MNFSVIYKTVMKSHIDPEEYLPYPGKWALTENDDYFEKPYPTPSWDNGHHRKWYTVFDNEHTFSEFLDNAQIYATSEDCPVLIRFGDGLFNSIYFDNVDYGTCNDVILEAFVTPYCDTETELLRFLEEHGVSLPLELKESPNQMVFDESFKSRRTKWSVVADIIRNEYT